MKASTLLRSPEGLIIGLAFFSNAIPKDHGVGGISRKVPSLT